MLKFKLMQEAHYIIRPMRHEDISQIVQIDREAFPGEWMFRSRLSYKRDLTNPSVRYITACINNKGNAESKGRGQQELPWFKRILGRGNHSKTQEHIIGFAGFWRMLKEAHISIIGVRHDYRRIGIGEGMLISVIESAALLNADVITPEVRASNEIAQALYKKYGFQIVGKRLGYYSINCEDAVLMSSESLSSISFQAYFQQLKKVHDQRYHEILSQVP